MTAQLCTTPRYKVEDFRDFLDAVYNKLSAYTVGQVARGIPELERADPDRFGISIVDVCGHSLSIGDVDVPFTMQSAIKPFIYGSTIENLSDEERENLIAKIGFEPTGTPYNSLLQQEDIEKGVFNPMLNAGAIVTTASIKGNSMEERWGRLTQMVAKFAGRQLSLNTAALESKKKHDHRILALAHLIYSEGLLTGDLDEAMELYCRQCSIEATCRDAAVMAATLANTGVNPITQTQVVKPLIARNMLCVMYTCGLYNFSGQWAYRVGLPAKSSLSGVVLCIVPNVCGIAIYSPRLGKKLISLRGIKVCEAFSKEYSFHIFFNQHKPDEKDKLTGRENGDPEPPNQNKNPSWRKSRIVISAPSRKEFVSQKRKTFHFAKCSEILTEQYHKLKTIHDGTVYQIEHGMQEMNPNWFGVCAVSTTGDIFRIGDHDQNFLIQSISKIFTYGMALEDYGKKYVLSRVDVEPTGKSYDSIIRVQQKTKRPHNPMVNAGAIAISSLIQGETPALRLTRILDMYQRYGGRKFHVDMPTYISEQNGGYRNLSIAYLLRNFNMIEGEILQTLDLYLQQCSVVLNCYDLALMGATLANGGTNPLTKVQAIKTKYVQDVLSVMFTCGMYDFTGEWAYKIGFPAKSGVSGAIVIVVPGECGIAIYSPPLDWRGNSVRGIKLSEALFKEMNLHIFDPH